MVAQYLTNGSVAWRIPPGRIANLYRDRVYEPPPGWKVVNERYLPKDLRKGKLGEMRPAIS